MKTLFVGQNSIHVESLDSTNSYASEMLRQIELAEGSVIYSFKQLKGRGQRGSSWESEPNKNVALSLILYPKFLSPDKQFFLTRIASLAVADVMADIFKNAGKPDKISIKWPNDIFLNDKKVAGILIENALRENGIQQSIIGIGINVNQVKFSTTTNAISLALSLGNTFDLMNIIELLCENMEARYLQLKANKEQQITDAYLARLYKRGEWCLFENEKLEFEGKITGVSATGKLQVELRNKEIREFSLKEIAFI